MRIKTCFWRMVLVLVSLASSPRTGLCQAIIPTGLYGMYEWGNYDDAFKLVRDSSFTVVPCRLDKALLDKAHQYNLKVLGYYGLTRAIATDEARFQAYLSDLKKRIIELQNHPALLAWYLVDEPDGTDIPVARVKQLRDFVRRLNTTKPMFTVFNQPDEWIQYLSYFDIIAVDPYLKKGVIDTPEQAKGWIIKVRSDMRKVKKVAPVWVVLGAFDLEPQSATPLYPKPTPSQFNQMVEDAIQQRVNGILVYTLAESTIPKPWRLPMDDPALWEAVKTIPLKANPATR